MRGMWLFLAGLAFLPAGCGQETRSVTGDAMLDGFAPEATSDGPMDVDAEGMDAGSCVATRCDGTVVHVPIGNNVIGPGGGAECCTMDTRLCGNGATRPCLFNCGEMLYKCPFGEGGTD
jgi:hypothetical protein